MKVIQFSSGCHYVIRPWSRQTENGFLIKPAEFYDDYSGAEQEVEVSKEVYDCMMTAYYQMKQYYQQFDRHQPMEFDEAVTGAVFHTTAPSAEVICFEHLQSEAMVELLRMLDADVARIIYLRFVEELTLREIAESEGMPISRVWRIIQKGLSELRKIIVNSDCDFSDYI